MSETAVPPLTIRLLGPFDVWVNGALLSRLRSRKGNWLLALLALRGRSEVDRAWLAGTLWPDSSEKQALGSLRMSLTDLRHALGPEARRLRSPSAHTLTLDLSGAEVDVVAFDAAIRRGDVASLEAAVRLHRGALLEGCNEEWVFEERQAREQEYLRALETLAAHAMMQEEFSAAVGYLQRAVAADPLRENAQRSLMQALAAAGSYAAATAVYRDLRHLLHRELNAEPAPETSALFQQIRAAARSRAGEGGKEGGSEGARERETGPAPLRSLVPSLALSLPRSSPPSHLPRPLTEFIGREREVREVACALAAARLVTLTGTGGVGKTRLAIRLAGEVAATYPDGARFVELGDLLDPDLIPQTITAVLHGHEEPNRTPRETLLDFLRPKELLLILDNCEHLIDACAACAEMLLRECPHLRVLATSRQTLGITGERAWRVPSLSLPEEQGVQAFGRSGVQEEIGASPSNARTPNARTPERLLKYEAVRLFVERARDAAPAFALTERNAGATLQICERLDGIPLAIELAAARLKLLTVEQIAARLDDRFRLLTAGSRTARPRQQTLRATLDWSYELLAEPERVLLRRLSVFPSSFALGAAEAICADAVDSWQLTVDSGGTTPSALSTVNCQLSTAAVLDLLGRLVDQSLVLVVEEQGEEARYRLLETVREYAVERLADTGETAVLRQRHRDCYLDLAQRAEPELRGPDQGVWLARLEREHENLRAGLRWCVENGDVEVGLRLAAALGPFWWIRGHITEGRERLAEVLALASAAHIGWRGGWAGDRAAAAQAVVCDQAIAKAHARSLDVAGILATEQGEYEVASVLLNEALALYRELQDRAGVASALTNLGSAARCQGEYGKARGLIKESLTIGRESGDEWGIATALYYLGSMAQAQGDYGTAGTLLEEALELQRHLNDRRGIAKSLRCLGYLASQQGDFARARALSGESLAIARQLGARELIAAALTALGDHTRYQGDYSGARHLYGEGLTIARELGDQEGIATLLQNLGQTGSALGEFASARTSYEQSLAIVRRLGDRKHIAWSQDHLARATLRQGDLAGAHRLAEESLAIRRALGDRGGIASSLCTMAEVAGREGDVVAARTGYRESLSIRREQGDRNGIAECLEGLGAVSVSGSTEAAGRDPRSARLWGAAEALRERIGSPLPPSARAEQDRRVAAARTEIGADAFDAAWLEGRALTIEEAIQAALQDV
jgi:predicted ATPase/DNA-binding SARP family transcriptional activator